MWGMNFKGTIFFSAYAQPYTPLRRPDAFGVRFFCGGVRFFSAYAHGLRYVVQSSVLTGLRFVLLRPRPTVGYTGCGLVLNDYAVSASTLGVVPKNCRGLLLITHEPLPLAQSCPICGSVFSAATRQGLGKPPL
jgi:hypothetical protein